MAYSKGINFLFFSRTSDSQLHPCILILGRLGSDGTSYVIDGSQTSPLTHSPLATFLLLFVINSNFLNTRSTRSFQASNSSAESSTILTFNVAPRPWRSHSLPNQEKGKATSICVSFSRPAHGQSMPKRSRPALELESTFSKLCRSTLKKTPTTPVEESTPEGTQKRRRVTNNAKRKSSPKVPAETES